MIQTDLIIIGAGPGGYETASRAAEKGLNTVIIEKEALGGTCLNAGCIPTKCLCRNAEILDYAKDAATYGINLGDVNFNFQSAIERKNEVAEKLPAIFEQMQQDMLDRARAHRDSHTYEAKTYEESKDIIANKPGFVKAMWCGEEACELKIKDDTTATSRCMPFEQEKIADTCVCCGKPAKSLVYWGKAY